MMNSKSLKDLISRVRGTDDWNLFKLRVNSVIRGDSEKFSLWFSYKLARNTHLFSDEVRSFLFDNSTYKEISEVYGISEGVLKNKIFREVKNYYDFIGMDLYYELLNGNLDSNEVKLIGIDLKEKYDSMEKVSKNIEDYFVVDIFSGSDINHDFSSISYDDYVSARDIASRLSIPANQFLLNNLNDKLRNYIVYLLTFKEEGLTKEELERKENLILFLKLEEHFNN